MANGSIAKLMVEIGADIKRLERGLSKAQRKVRDTGRSMQRIGSQLTRSITVPLATIGGTSVKAFADFEEALNQASAQANLSAKQMSVIGDEAQRMSVQTGQAASDIIEAYKFTISAGQNLTESQETVQAATEAAATGFGTQRDLVRLTTTALQAYGDEVSGAREFMDLLVGSAQSMEIEVNKLGPALQRNVGTAKNLGISLDQLMAGIGSVSEIMGDAQRGGRMFQTMLSRLNKPSSEGADAINQVFGSIENFHSAIRDEGLLQTMVKLRTRLEEAGGGIDDVFTGQEGLEAALNLTNRAGARTNEILSKMGGTAGSTNDAFENTHTVTRTLTRVWRSLEMAGRELGGAISDALNIEGIANSFIQKIGELTTTFSNFSVETKQNIVALGIALAALPPILFTIGTALLAITSPITWITVGLAGVSAAILYLVDNWDAVIERLSDIGWWRNTLISMAQFVIEYGTAPSLLIKGWNAAIGFITDLTWFKDLLVNMGKWLLKYSPFSGLTAGLQAQLDNLEGKDFDIDIPDIPNPFEDMADGLEDLKVETQDYEHQFGSFTDAVINGSKAAMGWLGSFLDTTPQFKVMGDAFTNVGNTISDVMKGAKNDVQDTTNSFRVMGDAFTYVGNSVSQLKGDVSQDLSDVEERAKAMQRAIGNGVTDMIETFAEGLGKMAAGVTTFKGVFSGLKGIGMSVLESLANLAQRVGRIAIAVGVGIESIKQALRSLNPYVAIAAGASLIALGAWAKSSLQKAAENKRAQMQDNGGVPALASGGLAFGPTMAVVGDNKNARSNPEVIAPLDKLQGMMASSGGGATRVEGVIRGSDIHLANERGKNKFR